MTWQRHTYLFTFLPMATFALAGIGVAVLSISSGSVFSHLQVTRLLARVLATFGCLIFGLVGFNYFWLGVTLCYFSRIVRGPVTRDERRLMNMVSRVSENYNLMVYSSRAFLLMVGVVGILAAILCRDLRWLGIVAFSLGITRWLEARTSTPPYILFLSTSDSKSIETHKSLKSIVSPVRVVSLLNMEQAASEKLSSELTLDCLRTGNDNHWWAVITMMIDMAPIIVINADTDAPGVVKEAIYLITRKYTYKTTFVTTGDAKQYAAKCMNGQRRMSKSSRLRMHNNILSSF